MKRFFKFIHKLLWWILYITPVILSAYYFGGKLLRKLLIDELNEQLNVKVEVYSININGLKTFPNLSLELTNVRIHESMTHYNEHLLQARQVVVVFNPLRLISGHNEIDRIELKGGALRMFTGKTGKTNFEILKPQETEDDAALNLDLKKVVLSQFQCIYQDLKEEQSLNFKTDALTLSGRFDQERYLLKSKGDALFDHLSIGGMDYILGKRCKMDVVLDVNSKIQSYHIEKAVVGLDNLQLDVKGDVLMVGNQPDLDLDLSGHNIDIQSVISVLPNNVSYNLRQLKSSGEITVNGHIKGSFLETSWPEIEVKFAFDNTSVRWKEKDLDCRKISLTGSVSNIESKDSRMLRLHVDIGELQMPKSYVKKGFIRINDLSEPGIDFQLQGLLDLSDISGVLATNKDEKWYGRTLFNLSGGIPYNKQLGEPDFSSSTVNGDIDCRDLNYSNQTSEFIRSGYAKARIAGNNLTGVEITGEYWKNNVQYTGDILNWQGFLFSNQRLGIEGALKSKYVNLNFSDPNESQTDEVNAEQAPPQEKISIDLGFDANVTVEIDTFDWDYVHAGHMTGKLLWKSDRIIAKNLHFNAWDGYNELDGDLRETDDLFVMNSSSISENVRIEHLLNDFDNFGQTEFTPEILQGHLNTIVDISLAFDRYFNVIEDSVKCLADLTIRNGRLKDYKTLETLSGFVELDDLKDIRFEELHNTVEIGNRVISIPAMEIKNSAMNLEVGGTHSFDNYMRYHMKIRVTELLANKSGWVKRKRERQLEEDNGGGLSAFILMEGTPDDLKIKYDRKAVMTQITSEAKNEGKNFFKELKKEIKREKTTTEDSKKVEWDE